MTTTHGEDARVHGKPRFSWQGLLHSRRSRLLLLMSLPAVIVLAGAYYYLVAGRYVSTDDAYVKAGKVMLSADVAGRVTEIDVRDNQRVRRGEILFRLDDRPYHYALDRARANLGEVRARVEALRASYRQKQAELQSAQDTATFQQKQFERSQALVATKAVSQANFDSARRDLQVAVQSVASTRQQLANILASLGGDANIATDQHPMVQQAQAQLDQATLDLERTTIYAPADGVVSQVESLQVGEYLNIGAPAFALLSTAVWIEANFKETDLTHMRPGDPASVTLDTYPGHRFEARVQSLSAGTGAEFSVLPPQNATGNWIKVTQRLPVRIAIDHPDGDLPLAAGMSADVEVDTGHRSPTLSWIEAAFAAEKTDRR